MEIPEVHSTFQKGIKCRALGEAPGFALVTLLTLVPLLMACMTGVGLTYIVLKRKSLAQSLCVNQAATTQKELKVPLEKLLSLNRGATALRTRRTQADLRLAQALLSGNPAVISAAKLARQVVILEQTAFGARQKALFADALSIRTRNERVLHQRVRQLSAQNFSAPRNFISSLALEPRPLNSLSPDYVPVINFTAAQQQRFRFHINIFEKFPFVENLKIDPKTQTECSVTLEQRRGEWRIQILAAKAP